MREVLRNQGIQVRRRAGTDVGAAGGRELLEDLPYRFPRVPTESASEPREARQLLATLSDGPTEREREEAKTALVVAYGPMVERTVMRFSASSRFPRDVLVKAGQEGLSRAIESFERVRALAPPPGCRRVDFRSYTAWCIGQSVAHRLSELEREQVKTALLLAHRSLVEQVIMG